MADLKTSEISQIFKCFITLQSSVKITQTFGSTRGKVSENSKFFLKFLLLKNCQVNFAEKARGMVQAEKKGVRIIRASVWYVERTKNKQKTHT